ncbi:hypothetical protein FG379_000409 [Cryptosporidium bovis]|uniref:uncharacterized protein n=1 Tax=Cryptosporidium bovis TaxID=310047 RepID=UPI00351A067E|nr:hypothetical protein FG379_000409 [Cryptosporidium bovis]
MYQIDPYSPGYIPRNSNYNGNSNRIDEEWLQMNDKYEHNNNEYNGYEAEFDNGDEGDEIIESEFIDTNDEGKEDVICCPMEMLHNRRHLKNYRQENKRNLRKSDLRRIPKFRNPWMFHNECNSKIPKDSPLTFEEAQVIREIWQDTRAQYSPSDGEIEKEYLFEEEYDDDDAEKRRLSIIEKGASLVRYSRHYELPTISTIIKSSNPEQFRSRSLSPFIRDAREEMWSRTGGYVRGSNNRYHYGRNEYNNTRDGEYTDTNNEYILNCNEIQEIGINGQYRTNRGQTRGSQYRNSSLLSPLQEKNCEYREDGMDERKANNGNENNMLINGNGITLNVPTFSDINNLGTHRSTVQGINSEFSYLATNNSGVNSRRATSPELISSSKSTSRGPPPRIGVLEPMETTEGLISPVNQNRSPILSTPRIGVATPRSRHSRVPSNHNYTDNIPVVSPSAKQTVVFHMLPDADNNNSKATIFANPDTNNVVTELHITPGVDINVISTPTGPAIEYEISGGRNAKAHINFSSNPNTDKLMKSGEIPKINLPENGNLDDVESKGSINYSQVSGRRNKGHGDLSLSPNGRRVSTFEEELDSDVKKNNQRGGFGGVGSATNNNGRSPNSYNNINQSVKHHSSRSTVESPVGQSNYRIDDNNINGSMSNTKLMANNDGVADNNINVEITGSEKNEYAKHKINDGTLLNESVGLNGIEYNNNIEDGCDEQKNDTSNPDVEYNIVTKSHPNPFVPIRRIQQKRTGFTGCIINTLTCTRADTVELKTFRALNPVEVVHRTSNF